MIQPHVKAKITQEQLSDKVLTPCWVWGGRTDRKGYGMTHLVGAERVKGIRVHRYVYQDYKGPIDQKDDLHHLCEIKRCCNPDHLEKVDHLEHPIGRQGEWAKAKTHCPKGHEYTPENTMVVNIRDGNGTRQTRACRKCKYISKRRSEEKAGKVLRVPVPE